MPRKWSGLGCSMILPTQTPISTKILYPLSLECLTHVGQLFCYHLFIDLPSETKLLLLQRYYTTQVMAGTTKLGNLFETYCQQLLLFHDSILQDDPTIGKQWKSMCIMIVNIHEEIKMIQVSAGQDPVLPLIKMITLEQVFTIQHELKRSSKKQSLTFSLSGR